MKKDEGFITIELCVALAIFLIFFAIALPRIRLYNERLYINYLAWQLTADLRTSQQLNIAIPYGDSGQKQSTCIILQPHKYTFYLPNGSKRIVKLPPQVHLEYNNYGAVYFNTGNPYTPSSMTISIVGTAYRCPIYINSYGRIRI